MKGRKHKNYFLNKLKEEIQNAETAILTTVSLQGKLRSRPVSILEMDNSGSLWFFTNEFTARKNEIAKNPLVCVSYSNSKIQKYVSVTGEASIINNNKKIKELWSPCVKKWFNNGVSDPFLALLKIEIDTAEYWDPHSKKMLLILPMMEQASDKENSHPQKRGFGPFLSFLNGK